MAKVTVEKVIEPNGITKEYYNPTTKESYDVDVKYGQFIVNFLDETGKSRWLQISANSLAAAYKPVSGQAMGENGDYETK